MPHFKKALHFVGTLGLALTAVLSVTTSAHAATCTNSYTSATAVPSGYGAAYDVFTPSVVLVTADCSGATPLLKVGGTNQNQYIYKIGYAYKGGSWQQVTLTGAGALISNSWYAGSAQGTLPFTATDLATESYVVGYVCTYTGSVWKCGCSDTACTTGMWQVQGVKVSHSPVTVIMGTSGLPVDGYPSYYSRPDAYELFNDSPSQWPIGLAATNMLAVNDFYVAHATQQHLQTFIDFVNLHHLQLAVHSGGVKAGPNCGHGLESNNVDPPGYAKNLTKIKAAGGTVDYVYFDEPMTFGHQPIASTTKHQAGCEYTPQQIAQMAASVVHAAQGVFPNIRALDSEALFLAFDTQKWTQAIAQWLPAFEAAAGQPFAYFVMDINQTHLAPDQVVSIASVVKASGVKLGYFIDGNKVPDVKTGAQWVQDATSFYHYLESSLHIQPDAVFVDSWFKNPNPIPVTFLPESATDTVTNVLMRYILDHTQ